MQPDGVTLAAMASRSVAVQTEDSIHGSFSLWFWLTLVTAVTVSTATQMGAHSTSGDPYRSGTGRKLQKVEHNIQYALNQRRDSSGSHSPAALLEQMKERPQSIAQDMYILYWSCGRKLCALPWRVRGRPRRKSGAERGGTEEDLSNRFVATLLRSRFLKRRGCSPKEARSGLQRITTQSHHTHQIQHLLPPSHHRLTLQQQHLSPHHLSHVRHRFLVSSHQSSAQSK